jgi:altronate hydrolase
MYRRLVEDMDLNCGLVVDGEVTVAEMGRLVFEKVLEVASGNKTKSELLGMGDEEFVPWLPGPTV